MIIELRRELSDYEEDESDKNTGLKQTLAEAKRNEEAFKELKVFVEKMVEETTQVILWNFLILFSIFTACSIFTNHFAI